LQIKIDLVMMEYSRRRIMILGSRINKMTQQEAKNEKNVYVSYLIWLGTGIFDYLNTSAIYVGYLTPALSEIFKQTLAFVFFPIYAVNTLIYAALSLNYVLFDREKKTNNIKKENIIRLGVSIASALIVGVGVIGTLAFSATFGVFGTVLFAANLAMNGIFNFCSGIYHLHQMHKLGKELQANNLTDKQRNRINKKREAHKASAISYFIVAGTLALIGLSGGLAVLGGFMPLAAIGITAGVIGAAFCVYGLVKAIREHKQKLQKDAQKAAAQATETPESKPAQNTHDIMQSLDIQPQKKPSQVTLTDSEDDINTPLVDDKSEAFETTLDVSPELPPMFT